MLIFIDWYLPGYKAGGPIQSVANIVSHLKNDFDFSIITSNTDLHETVPYPNVKSDEWIITGDGTSVYYFSAANQQYKKLKQVILSHQFDVIYLNSFFSKFFTVFPLLIAKRNKLKCKIIVAPRGMLGSGALQLKSTKKKIFISAAKLLGLYNNVTWHASTATEEEEIKKVFGSQAKVIVAINLSKSHIIKPVHRIKENGKLKMAFLSRISPKKNLIAVHRYLAAMPADVNIQFDYYGPVDDKEHFEQCVKLFETLPPNIKATYGGSLEPAQITYRLSEYHFTILPTFNENFGHSIVESWVAGCPVIISNQTPWRKLQDKKCGWDLPLHDDVAFINTIKKSCAMQQQEFDEWSAASYNYGEEVIKNPEAIEQNKRLFGNNNQS